MKNFFKKALYGFVGGTAAGLGAALAGVQFVPPPGVDPLVAYAGGLAATAIATGLAGVVSRFGRKLSGTN